MTSLRNIEPKLVVKLQPFGTERVIYVLPYVRIIMISVDSGF